MFTKKDRIKLFNALERIEDNHGSIFDILSEAHIETPSDSDNETKEKILIDFAKWLYYIDGKQEVPIVMRIVDDYLKSI